MINFSRFDLNLLVVLDAIASEGSITRASVRLNLTQPAVSHALTRLRVAIGDPLFVRRGNAMVPTATARSILEPVHQSLCKIEVSLNELDRFDPLTTLRTFRVGMRNAVECILLPQLVTQLRLAAPHARLVSTAHDRTRLQQDLASGVIDVAVDNPLPTMAHVGSRSLAATTLLVACREGHPLVTAGQALDLATYLSFDHILVSSRRSGPASEDLALAALHRERRVVVRCTNPWSALQTVARSDLVATLHVADVGELRGKLTGVQTLATPSEAPASTS